MKSECIDQLAKALAKAQGDMKSVYKDKKNPFFKSRYSDFSSIVTSCRQVLSENGLSVSQILQPRGENGMSLKTILLHSSGQWIEGEMPMCFEAKDGKIKMDPQTIGSAITYYKRYAYAAIIGAATTDEDDDGNEASEPHKEAKKLSVCINEDQAREIYAQIENAKDPIKAKAYCLDAWGIDEIKHLAQERFPSCITWLREQFSKKNSAVKEDYADASGG